MDLFYGYRQRFTNHKNRYSLQCYLNLGLREDIQDGKNLNKVDYF